MALDNVDGSPDVFSYVRQSLKAIASLKEIVLDSFQLKWAIGSMVGCIVKVEVPTTVRNSYLLYIPLSQEYSRNEIKLAHSQLISS
jgi:hypothetical protein